LYYLFINNAANIGGCLFSSEYLVVLTRIQRCGTSRSLCCVPTQVWIVHCRHFTKVNLDLAIHNCRLVGRYIGGCCGLTLESWGAGVKILTPHHSLSLHLISPLHLAPPFYLIPSLRCKYSRSSFLFTTSHRFIFYLTLPLWGTDPHSWSLHLITPFYLTPSLRGKDPHYLSLLVTTPHCSITPHSSSDTEDDYYADWKPYGR
jgi:hypothetical protein